MTTTTTTTLHGAPRPSHRRGRRRGAGITLGLLVLALVLAAVAAGLWTGGARVETVAAAPRDVSSTVEVAGHVEGTGQAQVGATAPGTVSAVAVSPGQRVAAGDVLFRLDDRTQRAALEQARAAVGVAEARRAEAEQQLGADAALAEDEVRRAEDQLAELDRLEADGAVVMPADRARAEAALRDATARREAAASALADPDNAPGMRLATAERAQAEAARAQAELALEERAVASPVDGTVVERRVEPGDTVSPGVPLVVVAPSAPARIVLEPGQAGLGDLREGQAAEVLAGDPDEAPPIAGDVVRAGRSFAVRVEGAPTSWQEGTPVSVRVTTSTRDNALAVPAEALRGGGATPWVLVADGRRAERRDVNVGLRGDEYVEIRRGLEEGEEVVVGSPALKPGARIGRR